MTRWHRGENPPNVRCLRCGWEGRRYAHALTAAERETRITALPHRGCGGQVVAITRQR